MSVLRYGIIGPIGTGVQEKLAKDEKGSPSKLDFADITSLPHYVILRANL